MMSLHDRFGDLPLHVPIDMNPTPLWCRKTGHSLHQPGNC
jgi:hypothetical protein